MSREEIQNILIRLTDVTGYAFQDKQAHAAFQAAINEIERLLADEREKERKEVLYDVLAFNCGLGCTPQEGYKDLTDALRDTKHLVAGVLRDEREKVRQKCIETLERREPSSHAWFEAKRLIRQLDFTPPGSGVQGC